jgi:starch synthase
MARILMVASEAAPFVKTGGLADVLGGLPPALAQLGDEVAVLLPKYRQVELFGAERIYHELPVWVAGQHFNVAIDRVVDRRASYLFMNCAPLFDREGIYNVGNQDYADNHIRFAALSRAALEVARRIFRPDVIHYHDWQAALVAPYLRHSLHTDPTYIGIRLLLTIHNLGYQGIFPTYLAGAIGIDPPLFAPGGPLEFYGNMNLLKGGIVYADAINTVSQAYAREIQTPEFGFGLDGLLQSRAGVLSGILNGVDYSEWNPEHDQFIRCNYSWNSLEGKRECKRALLEELGLAADDIDRPLVGIVSRLADQKGFDLMAQVLRGVLDLGACLAVVGTGDPAYEQMFQDLAVAHPDRVGVRIAFDNRLAHRIEAGSDMFLMPSRYEPCGLNQIYSLRYGTIPVVRATGGLDDTIEEGTGFKFWGYSAHELYECIRVAIAAYQSREEWIAMMHRAMQKDFSWPVSAAKYSSLYQQLVRPAGSAAA